MRLEAVSIAQYQGGIQGSVDGSSRGVHHALSESYPVSHSVTGEFIPASARAFGSDPGLV